MVDRIYYSLNLSGNSLTKTQIEALLSTQIKPKLKLEEKEVINCKKILDQIRFDWLVSPKTLTPHETSAIFQMAFAGDLRVSENTLKPILDYIQVSGENPIVQAGLIQIEIIRLAPFTRSNRRMARLLSYLFLYKSGFDFRGFLVIEESWKKDFDSYQDAINLSLKNSNQTLWLEFFAATVRNQLEEIYKKLTSPAVQLSLIKSFGDLSDRQRQILSYLDFPGKSITNRKVQSLFGISQITASRELARLVGLNLIFSKGRGRSVAYLKI